MLVKLQACARGWLVRLAGWHAEPTWYWFQRHERASLIIQAGMLVWYDRFKEARWQDSLANSLAGPLSPWCWKEWPTPADQAFLQDDPVNSQDEHVDELRALDIDPMSLSKAFPTAATFNDDSPDSSNYSATRKLAAVVNDEAWCACRDDAADSSVGNGYGSGLETRTSKERIAESVAAAAARPRQPLDDIIALVFLARSTHAPPPPDFCQQQQPSAAAAPLTPVSSNTIQDFAVSTFQSPGRPDESRGARQGEAVEPTAHSRAANPAPTANLSDADSSVSFCSGEEIRRVQAVVAVPGAAAAAPRGAQPPREQRSKLMRARAFTLADLPRSSSWSEYRRRGFAQALELRRRLRAGDCDHLAECDRRPLLQLFPTCPDLDYYSGDERIGPDSDPECVDDGACDADGLTITDHRDPTGALREQYAERRYECFVEFVLTPDDTDIIAIARQLDRHLSSCPCGRPECRSVTRAPPPPDPDDDPYDALMGDVPDSDDPDDDVHYAPHTIPWFR